MEKQIFTIGYTIPAFDKNVIDFYHAPSLMDADIVLISPELNPRGGYGSWISFSSGGGCYDAPTSSEYEKKVSHLKKEVTDFLQAGKSVFVILSKEEIYTLSSGVSHPRKGENLHSTYSKTNYSFLPVSIGTLVSASGKNIEFSGNPLFIDFFEKFKTSLEYQVYVENQSGAQIIFTGKDKTKVLGAIYKIGKGHLITLPYINYDEEKFTKYKGKGEEKNAYWTKEATQFGKSLVKVLVDVDKGLQQSGDKTPPPDWVNDKDFQLARENTLRQHIETKTKAIENLLLEKSELQTKLDQEVSLKDLLFEKGKRLEGAISTALESLGYKTENFNDGILEIDHVINSPEGDRFIGEAEGKDNYAINIDKFSQLSRIVQEDLKREEVDKPAIGILFGNGFRLKNPSGREEQFTAKCISTAKSFNYILVRTTDLFRIAKYARESNDEAFAKKCRDALKGAVGGIVDFPELPK
jgi:hypothetical protein